jgi:hypothetical protein
MKPIEASVNCRKQKHTKEKNKNLEECPFSIGLGFSLLLLHSVLYRSTILQSVEMLTCVPQKGKNDENLI